MYYLQDLLYRRSSEEKKSKDLNVLFYLCGTISEYKTTYSINARVFKAPSFSTGETYITTFRLESMEAVEIRWEAQGSHTELYCGGSQYYHL